MLAVPHVSLADRTPAGHDAADQRIDLGLQCIADRTIRKSKRVIEILEQEWQVEDVDLLDKFRDRRRRGVNRVDRADLKSGDHRAFIAELGIGIDLYLDATLSFFLDYFFEILGT